MDYNILWKILHKMEIPDYLTCLLRNLYAGQEATVRALHGTTDCFKIGKGVCKGVCIFSPCLFNFYAEYIMKNAKLDESQAGIKSFIGIIMKMISIFQFYLSPRETETLGGHKQNLV